MIYEGEVKIFSDENIAFKGPGKKKHGFYNPTWKMDRDLQVLFCRYAYEEGARKFLDGMAATGIRGIRIKKEIDGDIEVHINDASRKSWELIKKNVMLNEIDAIIKNEKFCMLVGKEKYDYIDLDPYGSPAKYIPCIFEGAKKKTFVSISATDVATLSGVFRKTCLRRYGALPCKYYGAKEIGLRILIGYVAKTAATYDYSFVPQISYHHSHYFRIYGYVEKGAGKADKCMENIGWFYWDDGWKKSDFDKPCMKACGPVWLGKLHDDNVLKKIMTQKLEKLVKRFMEENGINLPYYESWRMAKETGGKQPPMAKIIRRLREGGWQAARTHFDGNAFKSDAPYEEIKKLFERG